MDYKVAVIGLGYVGLPLAVEVGKKYPTVGFEDKRTHGYDRTREVDSEDLKAASQLMFSSSIEDLNDCNIAFVNELSLIFEKLEIDTGEVLEAAGTKWNFLKFSPGLVGGHCIGVDPFYLTYKAEELGYHPQVILSGRKINDNMGAVVAQRTIKLLSRKKKLDTNTRVLLLGITFKENCPDIRNSRVIDIYRELDDYGIAVDVFDPNADPNEVREEYGIEMVPSIESGKYGAIIAAVSHDQFKELNWMKLRQVVPVIYDVEGFLSKDLVDSRL